jgi:putative isomerase
MKTFSRSALITVVYTLSATYALSRAIFAEAQSDGRAGLKMSLADSSSAKENNSLSPVSAQYAQVQRHLAQGWNTWDVHSVTTHVLLPEGLAIRIGLMHNSSEGGDTFLGDTLIGRLTPGVEQVFPGEHSWDGSYTDLRVSWKGHSWRIQSARDGDELVLLATPLPSKPISALPPTITFSVNFLWNGSGTVLKHPDSIETRGSSGVVSIYCTCTQDNGKVNLPIDGPYFSTDFTQPVGVSTGKPRTLTTIESVVERQHHLYQQSISAAGKAGPIVDAIETTLGWDTIFEPKGRRVVSPVSRVWSVGWGGYVIFDWDTFFAATMASIGDRDLAYADAIETLRESTEQGFVPNYARTGSWKSSDRSEPPVGSITVLGLYRKFHDRWFLEETFQPLLQWNRWWTAHRDVQGYLTWGSDGENKPVNLDDRSRGARAAAILESGLDNSPMYDNTTYNSQSHLLDFADVGLMSMYIADCDALATMADTLDKPREARELRERSARYRAKLGTLWSAQDGIFLNRDLSTGKFSLRLSPTNFYPLLAKAATPDQVTLMIQKHLLNPDEFWGQYVMPSIARNDPAFAEQNYWRGRIWGPMNYLVYLGLRNYDDPKTRQGFAQKSFDLFLEEWTEKGHVHENYNAITGTGDDVTNSDRFYHWGALLGYIEYLEQTQPNDPREK